MKHLYKITFFLLGLLSVTFIFLNTTQYKIKIFNKGSNTASTPTLFKKNITKQTSYQLKKSKIDNLTPEEYAITQKEGTEAPFTNKYWDNKKAGIYVDIVSGKALFSSLDKYDSGSGWPSFTQPLEAKEIGTKIDKKLSGARTEIHSQSANTHLGHVFNDGPVDKGGKRFCVNSTSLKFIPLSELKKRGYEKYLKLFKNKDSDPITKPKDNVEVATLAGGCFWGVEHLLKKLPGVISAQAGYTGGNTIGPTYRSISTGLTDHAEAVQITFDPKKVSYTQVLSYFWRLHNPTELNKQGPDVGTQYRSAIFYHSALQKDLAEQSLIAFDKSGVFKKKVTTKITKASIFYPAEEYHQDYFEKNPGRVCHALRAK